MEVTDDRRAECENVVASIAAWARDRTDLRAVGIAGSWARGTATMSSDLDLVILTDAKEGYLASDDWVVPAVGRICRLVQTREWGALTERRITTASGFEIECGFAPPTWASVDPLDAGTGQVVRDGFQVVYDPDGLLATLIDAVR